MIVESHLRAIGLKCAMNMIAPSYQGGEPVSHMHQMCFYCFELSNFRNIDVNISSISKHTYQQIVMLKVRRLVKQTLAKFIGCCGCSRWWSSCVGMSQKQNRCPMQCIVRYTFISLQNVYFRVYNGLSVIFEC